MNYTRLIKAIAAASQHWQARAITAVNQALVVRNWLVGAYLVEFEQHGKDRAQYGARLLERLARDLAARGLRGLEIRNLRDCRTLYTRYPQIRQTVSAESLEAGLLPAIREPLSLAPVSPLAPHLVLQFSWSKLQELIRLDDPLMRAFYENECLKGNWSVRQLQRQIGSLLYERTALSKNKPGVVRRAHKQERQETPQNLIRDPYVLEFTGLAERPEYLETDLEAALLDHLQAFLLELGTGFCFEARQKRITVGRKHEYIDLVFYQRRFRFHLLLDLKSRAFRHADAGQMNFYLNWWKTHGMEPGDNPPVGIILCSDRDRTEVEFATAGMDNRLFVSRYLTALPSVEQLRAFVEQDRDRVAACTPPGRKTSPRRRTQK